MWTCCGTEIKALCPSHPELRTTSSECCLPPASCREPNVLQQPVSDSEAQQIYMASMEGSNEQALVNRKWVHKRPYTSIPSQENLNAAAFYTTTSPPPRPSTSTSPWHPKVGRQTTQPRPVFSPHSSYKRHIHSSTCEFYPPPSKSDLTMGSMNSRDQNSLTTPLKDPLEDRLPPPPPLVNGARLGFIIML